MKDSTGRAMASRNGQELNGFWNGRVRKDPHRGKKNRVLQEKTALNLPEKLMAPGIPRTLTTNHRRFLGADQTISLTDHGKQQKGLGEEGERTDGRERSSANLRACSLLAVLLTVASDEALKLLLDDSLRASSSSPPPCSSSSSMSMAACGLPSGNATPSPPLELPLFLAQRRHRELLLYILASPRRRRERHTERKDISSYLPRPPTDERPAIFLSTCE